MSNWHSETALLRLIGGLWHTTSPERFQAILKSGAILPEPDIPDSQRYSTSQGPTGWHLTRKLGGISLFDFAEFEPVEYEKKYPNSNWYHFVPFKKIGMAVWIEIDRSFVSEHFLSGNDLLKIWKDGNLRHRIMPYIEAAHIGALPISAFKQVLLADRQLPDWQNISL